MIANFDTAKSHNYILSVVALAALAAMAALPLAAGLRTPITAVSPSQALDFGKLPLSFEPNAGQTDSSVRFMAHAPGGAIYFTRSEVVLSLPSPLEEAPERAGAPGELSGPGPEQYHPGAERRSAKEDAPAPGVLRLQFLGANPDATIEGREQLPGKVNYLIGNDPSRWHTDLPTYSTTYYGSLYPGIDLKYEGIGGQLKGTFTVAPGADPSLIQWRYEGAQSVHIDEGGNIQVLLKGDGGIRVAEKAPVAWQEIGGEQVGVKVAYNLAADNKVSFDVAEYDRNYPLIIDPTLAYSTFLGGSGVDSVEGIAVDASGNAYVTGRTESTNFPIQNPFQPVLSGFSDAFVTKFNSTGSTLIYSTYLGGSGPDEGSGIAVDASGNAYVSGSTSSTNFPLQDPFQSTLGGSADAFVTKFSPTGSALLYSTYLGGSALDISYGGIAVDASGNAYVTGYTASTDFPLQNPFQPTNEGYEDAFVTKFSPTGSTLLYSTYLGGDDYDRGVAIAVDSSGNAYVTGRVESTNFPLLNPFQPANNNPFDAFVTKFSSTGSTLLYSTYLGGSVNDEGWGIAVDAQGNAYVTGSTSSEDFPLQDPFQPILGGNRDAFVTKFNSRGSALLYSTHLGGSGYDEGRGIAVDASGNAYVTGWTASFDLPLQEPLQPTLGGFIDAFVTKVSPTGSALLYSTYLGGSGYDRGDGMAADSSGNAYVTGETESANFPLQNPFQPIYGGGLRDTFVAKINPLDTLPPTATPPPATLIPTNTPTPPAPTSTAIPTSTQAPPTSPTVTPSPCSMSFDDVLPTHYFYEPVRYLYCRGVISGYSDNTFRPHNNAIRGQMVKIITLAFGYDIYIPPTAPTFSDVAADHPFYAYVETAAHNNLVSGYADGTFRPVANVTRGQLSKITVVAGAWSLINPQTPTFSDVPRSHPFYTYIETAHKRGIISGYEEGTFRPYNDATRGQISKIVYYAVTSP